LGTDFLGFIGEDSRIQRFKIQKFKDLPAAWLSDRTAGRQIQRFGDALRGGLWLAYVINES